MQYDAVIAGAWARQGQDRWSSLIVRPCFRRSETDLDRGGDDFHGSDGPDFIRAGQG